ncbi:DEAD/DEAH box helicase [Flavobacteriaceae bacterium F89]|uniref:DEAD/DEAH box helicase n=1 Tax=Cerina litoralis TaxID=2874477 RepID=A0AAE3EXN9_9FLAO|nr:DEAD/DEAH box helicase [Cerina litoralis]MCG2462259.1 DEAD/DEAH box helicase [Cerina litoralis]
MTFKDLGIVEPILKALTAEGYTHPTPIQEQSIPILLRKKDLLGCAQTGTGKTAAFAIPILQQLFLDKQERKGPQRIKSLVVTPTRELAIQIGESFSAYGRFTGIKNTVIFGGVKQGSQTKALRNGVDILVATPGRLLDLMNQGFISLRDIEYAVLDEADQMLDMGFIHDVKKIIAKLPPQRQSLFFSATMPPAILELSRKLLGDFEKVSVRPEQATAEKVEQSIYYVSKGNKTKLLVHLLEQNPESSVLVFSRTKHGANKIVKQLNKSDIKSNAIHGNKSQAARQRALGDFKEGKSNVLIATDIAARGIDVEELGLVINYDLPNVPETYVHRIGRTGRASASGSAVSFCDREERPYLRDIQKLIDQKIPVVEEHPFVDEGPHENIVQRGERPRHKQQYHSSKPGNRSGSNSNRNNRRRPNSRNR